MHRSDAALRPPQKIDFTLHKAQQLEALVTNLELLKNNAHMLRAKLVALAIAHTGYILTQYMNAACAWRYHTCNQIQQRTFARPGGTVQKYFFT